MNKNNSPRAKGNEMKGVKRKENAEHTVSGFFDPHVALLWNIPPPSQWCDQRGAVGLGASAIYE